MKYYLLVYLLLFFAPSCAQSHHPQTFLHSVQGSSNEGEQIYQHFCASCHATKPLISLGAPRVGVLADWKIRLKQPVATFLNHLDTGINAMPPRGGCFECSDEQLLLSVLYMLPKESKKLLLNQINEHKKSIK